ncbi:MAG TPA: class II glutamine amidotransferase [Candidatus Saccharimonadales bacterium]|nr:class II glutamine amidotransferase [Candidatus Saccharimonadales bacterium]
MGKGARVCRHIAWLGEPRSLASLLYDPPFALVTQQWRARHQRTVTSNADGFGVGWYTEGRAAPLRHRRAIAMGEDAQFAIEAGSVCSPCFLGAIRHAYPASTIAESCTAPFRDGIWLFSHNGYVEPPELLADLQRSESPVSESAAPVDSAALFGMAVGNWRRGETLGDGLAAVINDLAGRSTGPLNLLAVNGHEVAATAWGNSLFVKEDERGVAVASEPYDEGCWRPVPDRSLVTVSRSCVKTGRL